MPSEHLNFLKLLYKNLITPLLFLCIFSGVGCTSLPKNVAQKSDDAIRKIETKTQAAWESHPYQANAEYHFILAQAYSADGQVDRAIEEYRAALEYDSDSAMIHARLANEYTRKGMMTFALEECKKSIKLDSTVPEVHRMLGGLFSMSGETQLALKEYDAALAMDSADDEAAVFKAQVLAEADRVPDAIRFLKSFTAKTKDSAAAWFYLGKLQYTESQVEDAVMNYRKALQIRPNFAQVSLALGMVFEVRGENKKAIEIYEAQIEERQDGQVANRLATLYLKMNRYPEALKVLQAMMVMDPEDLNTQMKIGLISMQQEKWADAELVFLDILKNVPDSDKVNYYLAAVYEEMKEFEKAIDYSQKVTADSKLFEDANLRTAAIYRKLLKKEKAIAGLKDALQKSPENAGLYIALASFHEDENQLTLSLESLKSGLHVFPEHEKMRYFYGALLDKAGKQDEAVEEMEKVLKQNPDNADALNFIGYTWTTRGIRMKDAEEMLKKALKIKPENPFILDSVGWNQFMLGKTREAMIYLEKAVSLKGDEEAILEHLAEVYARNKMPERAETTRLKIKKIADSTRTPASVEER